MLSPFIFGSGNGKQGFYGIQTMNFQMNMASTANRAWRGAMFPGDENPNYSKEVSIEKLEESLLYFQYLTPHPSDLLMPRNVVPYYELPIYRTTNIPEMPGRPKFGSYQNGVVDERRTVQFDSRNIQLSSMPDKLIVSTRKPVTTKRCSDADFFATIKNITITWNNQSGLLASMTPEQLYRNSIQSGLTGLTWDQFSGSVVSVGGFRGEPGGGPSMLRSPYAGLCARNFITPNPGVQLIPTTGTILY